MATEDDERAAAHLYDLQLKMQAAVAQRTANGEGPTDWQRQMLAALAESAGNGAPPLGGLSGAPTPIGLAGLAGAATMEDIVRGHDELGCGVDAARRGKMLPVTFGPEGARFDQPTSSWQKPWAGHYDPMSFHPAGSWYGRGVTPDVARPLTVSGLVSMIMRGQSKMGGTSPSRWELTRELASELANDPSWVVQGPMPGIGIMDDVGAGTLKVCGVPIVLEKTTQEMLSEITRKAFKPGRGEFVAAGQDIELQKMTARLHDKDVEILRLKRENERLRSVAGVALKAANPLCKVNVPPLRSTPSDPGITMVEAARSFFTEHYAALAKAPTGCPQGFGAPDPASVPAVAVQPPKPPIPMRALSNDRQPIGLYGWK